MSPNRHSISAISTVKKLNTPLKASVVLLTAIILSSCATDGGDETVTPKPSPILPTVDAGGTSGSGTSGSGTSGSGTSGNGTSGSGTSGSGTSGNGTSGNGTSGNGTSGNGTSGSNTGVVVTTNEIEKSIKAAEAKTKVAEEALKVAEAKTKAAEDVLRAAQERFGKESEKAAEAGKIAIETARAEVVQAKATAEAARAEAVAKIEAAAKASKEQVDAAKKTAAEAVEKVKNAEDKVKSADIRANLAESKAKEIEESLKAETAAKEAAEEAKEKAEQIAKDAKAQAELEKQKANNAKIEADKAKGELASAQAALDKAEKDLAEALANGGNPAALQAEVDRRQAALDAANDKVTAAQQAQAAATAAAEAQVAVANQAAKDAKDALAASQIKNAPETKKTGVQHVSIDASGLGQGALTTTTRDFGITDATQVQARADIASGGLVSDPVALKVSGANDAAVAGSNGFKSFENTTKVVTASLGEQDLVYTSTYKDFGNDLRVAHIDGTAAGLLPVNGVAVVGNATQVINMPTEGKVGYTGDATYREIGLGKDIQFGTSVFTADFVAKNLKGDLTFSNKTIGLEAAISGNQFSGSKDGYNADGGFFGGDAQYLGGVYEGNGAQGTYGAKSNKQTAAEQAAVKAQADADKANAAIAAVQAAADKAQAAATKAQADATKAQEALAAAEDALANAGNGQDQLALALERAALAEAAQAAALEAASKAETAKEAALLAQSSAEAAATAAQVAADKAIGEAKIEADKKVATANQQAADAKAQAADAQAEAATAKTDAATAKAQATKAKEDAAIAIAAANANAETANQQAKAAQLQAQVEKDKAKLAQDEANEAKSELAKAEAALEVANKALADALASGGNNTAALQAEVDRRQAALDAANDKVTAAQQAQAAATAAAEAQVAVANQAAKDAKDALAASQIKNAPETKKTGVQHVSIDASGLGQGALTTTTRDFGITDATQVQARADIASGGLVSDPVALKVSGANDAAVAGSNGFKSFENTTKVVTASLGEQDLVYTSTYKDFGNDLRVAHIDGTAAGLLPVNGVAVVGNATQVINMPTEGKVGYTGDATYREIGLGKDIQFGTSVFTADFVAKNLKGDLTFSNKTIGLEAAISGNQFSGSKDGYNADGGFFGGDAQYLGGVYEGNGAQGTYGAKSNKQTAAEQAAVKAQADADKANAAIAAVQAAADKAQAAATKAQADATKAQEALAAAEDALANAGNGQDQLALALERAALAEAAQAAALEAASKAETAKEAALLAQSSAEAAATAAQVAADKAIGEANEQKAAKERAEVAKAAADKAKDEALAAKIASEKAKDEALLAKTKAEAARDEAIARAEAAEAEALAAANAFSAPDSRISGFQSTSVGKKDGIFENNSNSYDKINFYTNEVDDRVSLKPIELNLRGANKGATDSIYNANSNGFKEHKGSTSFDGHLGITIYNRNLDYSSVYKNFDNQMQIGHIEGKTTGTYREPISNVYVQGNATNLGDMNKLTKVNEGKAKYNGVASYTEGNKVVVDGKSKFDVDFVAKSLKGELAFTEKQVDIAADITNNTFASKEGAAVNTVGGFYGKGASLLGGVYERETKDSYIKGTYGATKLDPTVEVVPDPTESKMTGFQSTSLSSIAQTVVGTKLENAIGYVAIRDDKSDFTERTTENGSVVPVDNRKGDNFRSFDTGVVRADMVKPENVANILEVSLKNGGSVTVDAGKGTFNPKFNYSAVYKNFDSQMQTGHLYGNFNTLAGDVSRAANVYVEGYLTSQAGMDNLKTINDGKAQYKGVATYIENIHLADNASTAPVNGNSAFNADFVSGKVDGTLSFAAGGYKYMPAGNEIKINADITGNTFAGNVGGVDTAGGFYGTEGKFLGGIYQDASVQGGKGTVAGTGTKFQGTFGAEKQ